MAMVKFNNSNNQANKAVIQVEQQRIQLLGIIEHTQSQFNKLSFVAKLYFVSKWLNTTGLEISLLLKKQVPADEKQTVFRMLAHWQKYSHENHPIIDTTLIQNLRVRFEKNLISQVKIQKDVLLDSKALKKIITRSNKWTTPDPQLEKEVEKIIQAQRKLRLDKFITWFARARLGIQRRLLKILGSQRLVGPYSLFRVVKNIRNDLLKLNNEKLKSDFINQLVQSHQDTMVSEFVEKPRKRILRQFDLVSHQTLAQKQKSTQDIRRALFAQCEFEESTYSNEESFSNEESIDCRHLYR